MMEKKMGLTVKHREDVIDILQVRAKEKKVLIGLIIILLCTLGYENSQALDKFFFSQDFSVPELGKRKAPLVKPDLLKNLGKSLKAVEQQFPQFVEIFSRFHHELNQAALLAEAEASRQQATYNTFMICREIYKFAFNPVLPESKELKELQKQLTQMQKKFKFDLKTDEAIRAVAFGDSENAGQRANIYRSLFDYENF